MLIVFLPIPIQRNKEETMKVTVTPTTIPLSFSPSCSFNSEIKNKIFSKNTHHGKTFNGWYPLVYAVVIE